MVQPETPLTRSLLLVRHLKEQNQLPSSADGQEYEESSTGEAERLQFPDHHLPSAHQQQPHIRPASVVRQHHNPYVHAVVAGLHRRRGSPWQPRPRLSGEAARRAPSSDYRRAATGRHLPGGQRRSGNALKVGDGERRKRLRLRVRKDVGM